jgi:hypothetical protein
LISGKSNMMWTPIEKVAAATRVPDWTDAGSPIQQLAANTEKKQPVWLAPSWLIASDQECRADHFSEDGDDQFGS